MPAERIGNKFFGSQFRLVHIATRQALSTDIQFTGNANGHRLHSRIQNVRLNVVDRATYGRIAVVQHINFGTGRDDAVFCRAIMVHEPEWQRLPDQAAVQALYDLDDTALLDMGDFAGGLLKYLRKHPLPKLTIAGGFGKLSKLAAGYLDLHSGRSQVDFDHLAALADGIGAATELRDAIAGAETALQALELAEAARLPLADAVARDAQHVASDLAAPETEVEVLIFDRAGRLRGRSHA